MNEDFQHTVIKYYDSQAADYYDKFSNEVEQKPYDKAFLDLFAQLLSQNGKVLDIGCSASAQQANYLSKHFQVTAIDLSPKNIEVASKHYPHIQFHSMDMKSLNFQDMTFDGVSAFYSLIHIPSKDLVSVLKEIRRVLKPSGKLALAVHEGAFEGIFENHNVFFKEFSRTELSNAFSSAGFNVVYRDRRAPLYDFEYQSHRLYAIVEQSDVAKTTDSDTQNFLNSIRSKIPVLNAVPDQVYFNLDPSEFIFPDSAIEKSISEMEAVTGNYVMCYRQGAKNNSPRHRHLCSRIESAKLSDEHFRLLKNYEERHSSKNIVFVAYKKPLLLKE